MQYVRTDHIFENQSIGSLKLEGVKYQNNVKFIVSECYRLNEEGTGVFGKVSWQSDELTDEKYELTYFDVRNIAPLRVLYKSPERQLQAEDNAEVGTAAPPQWTLPLDDTFPIREVFRELETLQLSAAAAQDSSLKYDTLFYYAQLIDENTNAMIAGGFIDISNVFFGETKYRRISNRRNNRTDEIETLEYLPSAQSLKIIHPASLLKTVEVIDNISEKINYDVSGRSNGKGFADFLLNNLIDYEPSYTGTLKTVQAKHLYKYFPIFLNRQSELAAAELLAMPPLPDVNSLVGFKGLGQLVSVKRVGSPEQAFVETDIADLRIAVDNFIFSDAYGPAATEQESSLGGGKRGFGVERTRGLAKDGKFKADKEYAYSFLKRKTALALFSDLLFQCVFEAVFTYQYDALTGYYIGLKLRRKFFYDAATMLTLDRTLTEAGTNRPNNGQGDIILDTNATTKFDERGLTQIDIEEIFGSGSERPSGANWDEIYFENVFMPQSKSAARAFYLSKQTFTRSLLFRSKRWTEPLLTADAETDEGHYKVFETYTPTETQSFDQTIADFFARFIVANRWFVDAVRIDTVLTPEASRKVSTLINYAFYYATRVGGLIIAYQFYAPAVLELLKRYFVSLRRRITKGLQLVDFVGELDEETTIRTNLLNSRSDQSLYQYIILEGPVDDVGKAATLSSEYKKPPFDKDWATLIGDFGLKIIYPSPLLRDGSRRGRFQKNAITETNASQVPDRFDIVSFLPEGEIESGEYLDDNACWYSGYTGNNITLVYAAGSVSGAATFSVYQYEDGAKVYFAGFEKTSLSNLNAWQSQIVTNNFTGLVYFSIEDADKTQTVWHTFFTGYLLAKSDPQQIAMVYEPTAEEISTANFDVEVFRTDKNEFAYCYFRTEIISGDDIGLFIADQMCAFLVRQTDFSGIRINTNASRLVSECYDYPFAAVAEGFAIPAVLEIYHDGTTPLPVVKMNGIALAGGLKTSVISFGLPSNYMFVSPAGITKAKYVKLAKRDNGVFNRVETQDNPVAMVAISSRIFVACQGDTSVIVYDAATHTLESTVYQTGNDPLFVAASGIYLGVLNTSDKTLSIFNTATNLEIASSPFATGNNPTRLVATEGNFFVLNKDDETVRAYTDSTGAAAFTITLPAGSEPLDMIVRPDASGTDEIYVSCFGTDEVRRFFSDGAPSAAITLAAGAEPREMFALSNGNVLITTNNDGDKVYAGSTLQGAFVGTAGVAYAGALLASGNRLITYGENSFTRAVDSVTFANLEVPFNIGYDSTNIGLGAVVTGDLLFTLTQSGTQYYLYSFDQSRTNARIAGFKLPSQPTAIIAAGSFIYVTLTNGQLLVFGTGRLEWVGIVDASFDNVRGINATEPAPESSSVRPILLFRNPAFLTEVDPAEKIIQLNAKSFDKL
ncbi:MAG: YncE family protein [Rhizobacter sp.]|nr:YncE family protein [Chlorobiales bacterium]